LIPCAYTQHVRFMTKRAELSRKTACWALERFPNPHRHYAAFAVGFGHALARLLALLLHLAIIGIPGYPEVRSLAWAAFTQLRHGDVVLQFQTDHAQRTASASVRFGDRLIGPITDPAVFTPELSTLQGRS
jgi:hypothetical protein